LEKIICFFKGHKPYGRPNIIRKPPKAKTGNIVAGIGLATLSVVGQVPFMQLGSGIGLVGKKVDLHICRRCGDIVTYIDDDIETITNIKNYPALDEYAKWIKERENETKAHENNEAIKNAWNDY